MAAPHESCVRVSMGGGVAAAFITTCMSLRSIQSGSEYMSLVIILLLKWLIAVMAPTIIRAKKVFFILCFLLPDVEASINVNAQKINVATDMAYVRA